MPCEHNKIPCKTCIRNRCERKCLLGFFLVPFFYNQFISFQKLISFLSVGWGLMADIDIESERLRMIGEARFTVGALARIMRK